MKFNVADHSERWCWVSTDAVAGKQRGYLWATSREEAFTQLLQQQIQVIHLYPSPLNLLEKLRDRVHQKDLSHLTRQLAIMLTANLSLSDALMLIASQTQKAAMQRLIRYLHQQITHGVPVAESFKNTACFHDIDISLIHAGEISGQLETTFEQLAQYQERKEQLQAKITKAAIYPCIVMISTLLLTWLMLTKIIPQFEMMFRQFGASLPWFTRQILNISHQIQHHSLLLAALGLIFFTGGRILYLHVLFCRRLTEKFIIRLPVFGRLFSGSALIRCCRTLASCYHCGIPVLECLTHAKRVTGLTAYEEALGLVSKQVSGGSTLSMALRQTRSFPELLIQMTMVGEESDMLDTMLNKIADHYETQIDHTVDQLGQLIEPFIILMLGIIVGGLIIAMYLPLFNLMAVIG